MDGLEEMLVENRIIFITGEITQELANSVIVKMLYYESLDCEKDITIYLNTPGGDTDAMHAIKDMFSFVKPDICVVNLSCAYSAGSLIFACGTKGKRYMLPSAKVMIHQPSIVSSKKNWTCKELENVAETTIISQKRYVDTMLERTNISYEQMKKFIQKDTYLNAQECIKLGIADKILDKKH